MSDGMRILKRPLLRIAVGLLIAALLSIVGYQVFVRTSSAPQALLKQTDDLSWLNSWIAADPIYRQAEAEFLRRGHLSKALYARVSEIMAHSESSTTLPNQIADLRRDLAVRYSCGLSTAEFAILSLLKNHAQSSRMAPD